MPYTLVFSGVFKKDLDKLDKSVKLRLPAVFDKIEQNPYRSKQLSHYPNIFRERIGNFRLVYFIDEKEKKVTLAFIGKREDVYKRLH